MRDATYLDFTIDGYRRRYSPRTLINPFGGGQGAELVLSGFVTPYV